MTLSVAVPSNRWRSQLDRCLASCKEQSVTVFDSADDDKTGESCKRAGVLRLRIEDRGMVENWNMAVCSTPGDWIHLLHDDDYVRPGFYEAVAQAMQSEAVAFICGHENERQGLPGFVNRPFGSKRGLVSSEEVLAKLCGGNPTAPSAVVIRKDVYERVGYYADVGALDWDMYLRIAQAGGPWWYEPECLLRREEHEQSHGTTCGAPLRAKSILRTILAAESRGLDMMPARRVYSHEVLQEALMIGQAGRSEEAAQTFLQSVELTIRRG